MASVKKTALALSSLLFILFILTTGALLLTNRNSSSCDGKKLIINKEILCAKVADDDLERIQGLSGVNDMQENQAMLFVFNQDGKHGIWMKEMLMPIDIIWLSDDKSVVHIEEKVSPETYPKTYYPSVPSRYVIELKAGAVKRFNIGLDYQFKW